VTSNIDILQTCYSTTQLIETVFRHINTIIELMAPSRLIICCLAVSWRT